LLNASRRRRIAAGSGTTVQDVNKLMKQFKESQKLMKRLKKTGVRGMNPQDLFR
jgi:signal recognition particle subunit SRP54